MTKKIFLLALAMGMSMATFAQSEQEAINEAKQKQQDLLNKVKNNQSSIDWGSAKKDKQFFIGEPLRFGRKEKNIIYPSDEISSVYSIIRKSANIDDFTYSAPKPKGTKKNIDRKGNIKSYEISLESRCQTKTSSSYSDNTNKQNPKKISKSSEGDYDVTMIWKVTCASTKKGVKYNTKLQKIEPAKHSNQEAENKKNAIQSAEKIVQEWYKKNVPNYFADKMDNDNILGTSLTLNGNFIEAENITVNINKPEKEVTISSELPMVKIDVDPQKYMSTDSCYVDNPKAFYTFKAKFFKIKFTSDDYKTAELVAVDFEEPELVKPSTIDKHKKDMEQAKEMVNKAKEEIEKGFKTYLETPNKETSAQFDSLFVKNSKVGISILNKSGITTRKAIEYRNNIKGATIDFVKWAEPEINVDGEEWTAVIPFTQHTERDKYCDYTDKEVHLIKEAKSEKFKISSIEVVKEAQPCE